MSWTNFKYRITQDDNAREMFFEERRRKEAKSW